MISKHITSNVTEIMNSLIQSNISARNMGSDEIRELISEVECMMLVNRQCLDVTPDRPANSVLLDELRVYSHGSAVIAPILTNSLMKTDNLLLEWSEEYENREISQKKSNEAPPLLLSDEAGKSFDCGNLKTTDLPSHQF
jgi:predicted metal-binding protein